MTASDVDEESASSAAEGTGVHTDSQLQSASPPKLYVLKLRGAEAPTYGSDAWYRLVSDKPLIRLKDDPVQLMREYHYARFEPTAASLALVEQANKFRASRNFTHNSAKASAQNVILGKAVQTSLRGLAGVKLHVDNLHQLYLDAVTPALTMLGFENGYHTAFKLLLAALNDGEQPIHWDSDRWGEARAASGSGPSRPPCVSILVFLTDCDSTSLPIFPAEFLSTPSDDANEMRHNAHFLRPEFFHRVPVKAGTILIFKHECPHHGVRSDTQGIPRAVLFGMYSHKPDESSMEQDAEQYFSWHYVRDAFGLASIEFQAALQQALQLKYDPIARESVASALETLDQAELVAKEFLRRLAAQRTQLQQRV